MRINYYYRNAQRIHEVEGLQPHLRQKDYFFKSYFDYLEFLLEIFSTHRDTSIAHVFDDFTPFWILEHDGINGWYFLFLESGNAHPHVGVSQVVWIKSIRNERISMSTCGLKNLKEKFQIPVLMKLWWWSYGDSYLHTLNFVDPLCAGDPRNRSARRTFSVQL